MAVTEAQLADDLKAAMKDRDAVTRDCPRGVVTAIKNAKVEARVDELETDAIIQIIRREVRKRDEAAEFARKAGRDDLVGQNDAERAALSPYLPAMVTGEALTTKVRAIIEGLEDPNIGTVMRAVKAELGSNVDGREASDVVKSLLKP